MADIAGASLVRPANKSPALAGVMTANDEKLKSAAIDLEAQFLSEMLTHAGFGKSREGLGGGIGEDQFSSFLVQEQAKAIANQGGIGLAETLFEALKKGTIND
jgi:Rod binding domain-containing protein